MSQKKFHEQVAGESKNIDDGEVSAKRSNGTIPGV
jgi:hypothetical protein